MRGVPATVLLVVLGGGHKTAEQWQCLSSRDLYASNPQRTLFTPGVTDPNSFLPINMLVIVSEFLLQLSDHPLEALGIGSHDREVVDPDDGVQHAPGGTKSSVGGNS